MNSNEHFSDIIYYDELIRIGPKVKGYQLWEFSKDLNLIGLNRMGFLSFLNEHGFYRRMSINNTYSLVKITDNIIQYITKDDIIIYVRNFIDDIKKPFKVYYSRSKDEFKIIGSEQFINLYLRQLNLVLNDLFLVNLELNNSKTLIDTKDSAYLLFKNAIVTISKEHIDVSKYSQFPNFFAFESQIIDANFELVNTWKTCHFARFIKNVTNDDTCRKNAIRSALGYLLHGFNDPAKSQAVILYDEELTDIHTPKGGTGKGIIGQALSRIKKAFIQLDGKSLNLDSQFLFQRIKEDTRIIFIDDVAKSFNIDRLNSILTEGITIEEKFKKPIHVAKSNMPKFLIASNIILPFEGTTRIRRQFVIELSNHYSNKLAKGITEPILEEHKGRFFSEEWSDEQWNGFYNFIAKCVQYYLANGLMPTPKLNMEINRLIQKIGKHAFEYFEALTIQAGTEYITKDIYEDFKQENLIDDSYSQRRFSDNLKSYLITKGAIFEFKKDKLIIENIQN